MVQYKKSQRREQKFMQLLYFLESLRNPVLDAIFSVITLCGEETVFMAVGMIVFWCVGKYQGYYLLCTGFVGTVVNQFLKMLFRIPRPWVKDPAFTIVESAREAATGYSFPSGHTQTSVGLFGGLARWNRALSLRITMIALCVLVPLSRLYLGVHTPLDVGVSICIALFLVFVAAPLFRRAEHSPRLMYAILGVMTAVVVAYVLYVCLYPFPDEVYAKSAIHNLESAQKNGFTLLGCMLGFLIVYTADLKYIRFDTRAVWWAQILKALGGILLVLAAKELLRFPLDAIFGEELLLLSRCIRYFIIVLLAGIVWPLTFPFFARLGKK
ncbi:MAG: phosphatase PAP2 family protein [Ruminococcaceae bacterium]|nr:phosphatase PAP2 family protein [Oscillospiraceae bacterium]